MASAQKGCVTRLQKEYKGLLRVRWYCHSVWWWVVCLARGRTSVHACTLPHASTWFNTGCH